MRNTTNDVDDTPTLGVSAGAVKHQDLEANLSQIQEETRINFSAEPEDTTKTSMGPDGILKPTRTMISRQHDCLKSERHECCLMVGVVLIIIAGVVAGVIVPSKYQGASTTIQ